MGIMKKGKKVLYLSSFFIFLSLFESQIPPFPSRPPRAEYFTALTATARPGATPREFWESWNPSHPAARQVANQPAASGSLFCL